MEPCPRVEFDASGDESWDHSVFPVSESEHVFDEMHEGHVICLLESESSDASDDGGCNTNQFFREGWDWEVSLSNVMGQIDSLLQGFHQQCQEIHANSAMDARQKCQKLQEFKGGLESLKAGIAAPPVQTKTPKVYKMCDCENSIRILQKKYDLNVSKKKPERTSVQARYCECGCLKCTENGCGTDVCKQVSHYSPQYRVQFPDFWRRRFNCVRCKPASFCFNDHHYLDVDNYLKYGRILKSRCDECKVSRQAGADASTP